MNDCALRCFPSLQAYEARGTGCVGGLGELGTAAFTNEFVTWACVHQPQCDQISRDDLACFKYSHVRGEFLFWGWNSRLRLRPPLSQLRVSFCTALKELSILDAIGNMSVPVQDLSYVFNTIGMCKLVRACVHACARVSTHMARGKLWRSRYKRGGMVGLRIHLVYVCVCACRFAEFNESAAYCEAQAALKNKVKVRIHLSFTSTAVAQFSRVDLRIGVSHTPKGAA